MSQSMIGTAYVFTYLMLTLNPARFRYPCPCCIDEEFQAREVTQPVQSNSDNQCQNWGSNTGLTPHMFLCGPLYAAGFQKIMLVFLANFLWMCKPMVSGSKEVTNPIQSYHSTPRLHNGSSEFHHSSEFQCVV